MKKIKELEKELSKPLTKETIQLMRNMVEDKEMCGICEECSCNNYDTNCGDVMKTVLKYAFIHLCENSNKIIEEPETSKTSLPKTSLDDYASTINFMKKRGYTHCYMCGADLGGDTK